MNKDQRTRLAKRLRQLGARDDIRNEVEIEKRGVTAVSVPLSLLDELLVDAVLASPKPRGRPPGDLSYFAKLIVRWIGRDGYTKEELLSEISIELFDKKAEMRKLRIMVNALLRDQRRALSVQSDGHKKENRPI
jgi:hypothetical protein